METDINAAETKQAQLKLLLKQLNRVAVAFSGGIDSAFLLKTTSASSLRLIRWQPTKPPSTWSM